MLFIDLSLRNSIQGYLDSLDLIREAIPNEFDHHADDMRDIVRSDSCDTVEELHWVLEEAEMRTRSFGYYAYAHEGYYYVMTDEEWENCNDDTI